jgi:hypothetical protein
MNDSPQSKRWCAAGYSIINSGSNLECTAMPSSSPYVRFESNQQQGVIKNRGHRRPAPQPKVGGGAAAFHHRGGPLISGACPWNQTLTALFSRDDRDSHSCRKFSCRRIRDSIFRERHCLIDHEVGVPKNSSHGKLRATRGDTMTQWQLFHSLRLGAFNGRPRELRTRHNMRAIYQSYPNCESGTEELL